jgi:hypothetical protein
MSHCIIIKFPYSSCVFDYFNLIKISVRNPPTFGGGVGGGGSVLSAGIAERHRR